MLKNSKEGLYSFELSDDSRAERRRRLGEELEGRVHVISDKVFRENNPALREHKKKKHGIYPYLRRKKGDSRVAKNSYTV